MKRLLLVIQENGFSKKDGCLVAHWERRAIPEGEIALPALLDQWLVKIRTEHMEWAWVTGKSPLKASGGPTLADVLECGQKPSMWWTSLIYERHPKLSPWLYPLYKLRCIELLMQENGLSELEVYGGDRTLQAILRQLANAHSWKLETAGQGGERKLEQLSYLRRFCQALPAPLMAILRFLHWLGFVRLRLPLAKSLARAGGGFLPATIATYFPNIDLQAAGQGNFRSRYWESLHEALNRQARWERPSGPHFVRWLFIRFPSPDLSFGQCIKLKDLFQKEGRDGAEFHYLEEFLGIRDLLRSLGRWLLLCVNSFKVERKFRQRCHFKNSRLDFWPLLKRQWAESFRGWRSLERCLQNNAFLRYEELAGLQRWWLFPLENCPWERMLVSANRNSPHECPVYGAQHSIVRPTDFRYFDAAETFDLTGLVNFQPDVVGGNGRDACSQWLANGMPRARQRQLEALRYLYLAAFENTSDGNGKESLPPEPGEPLADNSRPTLLVLTSFFKDETAAHLRLLGEALDSGLLSGWQLVIKPHPYLPVGDWLDKRPESQRKLIRLATGPISVELAKGVTVWASNSTTAALESVLKGLAVMVMRPVWDFDLCPIQNIPGLARTGNLDEVKKALKTLKPLKLPDAYLDLRPGLVAWRNLLGLNYGKRPVAQEKTREEEVCP